MRIHDGAAHRAGLPCLACEEEGIPRLWPAGMFETHEETTMTRRDDWSGCDNVAQESVALALHNAMQVTRQQGYSAHEAGFAVAAGTFELVADAAAAALRVLSDLADGTLVTMEPARADELLETDKRRYNALLLQAERDLETLTKVNDDRYVFRIQKDDFMNQRDNLRKTLDAVVIQRDEARRDLVEFIAAADGAEADACDTYRAEIDQAHATIAALTKERDEARRARDAAQENAKTLVEAAEAPGSWGAGKGPTVIRDGNTGPARAGIWHYWAATEHCSNANESACGDWARVNCPGCLKSRPKPEAKPKPSCHGCEHVDTRVPGLMVCDFGDAKNTTWRNTIAMAPGASCPCWCPKLEVNQ